MPTEQQKRQDAAVCDAFDELFLDSGKPNPGRSSTTILAELYEAGKRDGLNELVDVFRSVGIEPTGACDAPARQ